MVRCVQRLRLAWSIVQRLSFRGYYALYNTSLSAGYRITVYTVSAYYDGWNGVFDQLNR